MADFQKDLLATAIFKNEADEEGEEFKGRIVALRDVRNTSIDENIDASTAAIVQLTDNLDYTTAAARIGMLLSVLNSRWESQGISPSLSRRINCGQR
jgi:hypothetical protein